MTPIAPSWFSRRLQVYHPTLRVRHSNSSAGWEITQMVPTIVDQGSWNGMKLYEVTRKEYILKRYQELGSRIFSDMGSFDRAHFRTYEDFCKHHKVMYQ